MRQRASLVLPRSERTGLEPPPVERPIRLGVAGLGPRGRWHVIPKAIAYEEFELVAVCDVRSALRETVVASIRDDHALTVRGCSDFGEMLRSSDLDAVAIVIDADKQVSLACAAMEAGCHVMIEVPAAYTLEDCWRLVLTEERTKRQFMMMEQLRFAGYVRAWRHIVQQGVIGKPLFVEGEYFGGKPDAFFQDDEGRYYTAAQAEAAPGAKATWRHLQPTIGYLPHELSPMLYVIDDRVRRVVGMSTRESSYRHEGLRKADVQAALMHTDNDVILRMATGHTTTALPRRGGVPSCSHWHHVKGSEGALEWGRAPGDKAKLWVEGWHLDAPVEVDWRIARTDAPPEAAGSGHGDLDYFVFAQFADALLHDVAPEVDVYTAVETAAPAILAAKSIEEDNAPQEVPRFRPGPDREAGRAPAGLEI